jgi:uncharacterized protein HemX
MTILLNILAALWSSQVGRMAIVAVIAGAVGYHNGYRKGDEGRVRLKAQYEQATIKLVADEIAKARVIQEESERDAAAHEAEMAEKDQKLEETNREIAELEQRNKQCGFVSRDTVRRLNSSR